VEGEIKPLIGGKREEIEKAQKRQTYLE